MSLRLGIGPALRCGTRRTIEGAACVVLMLAAGAASTAASAAAANAATVAGAGVSWGSVGVLAGSVQPDADLADYQWRTSPRGAWGVQALAGAQWFSGGVRLWNTRAEQNVGAPGAVTVRGTSWELVGRGRLLRVGGSEMLAITSGGRMRLAYDPERVEFAGGSGEPIVVQFAPINEWIAGAGLALERRVAGGWKVGIEVERRVFSLDTAHRNGAAIVERREALGDWNARVELARLRTSKGTSR